jgi:aminopeptidase N
MYKSRKCFYLLCLLLAGAVSSAPSQGRRPPSSAPKIDVANYVLQVNLNPEAHELKAVAAITFRAVETTDVVLFQISENLSVQRILDPAGIEIEFGQDESGPGQLTVRFSKPILAGASTTIKVEYTGGFDRDRYSRLYTRDESSAYIGVEGSYLLYAAKWFPINRFLEDRAAATVEVTVPLGFIVIGPGTQKPVITKGITETFGWTTDRPILPNSIVAGRYFEKQVQSGGFALTCYAREDRLDAMQKTAESAAKILDYFQKKFGPSATGSKYRLVEVDDKLAPHPGTLGTIFIPRRDLSGTAPAARLLARRIAYQWWMDTVGAQRAEDMWLVDGLAYYSAAMYVGDTAGPQAFKEEINNLAVLGLKFENKSAVRVGIGLGYRSEAYESVVAGKGAWVLHMLREIIGNAKFSQLLQEYAKQFAGVGGSTSEFQKLAEKLYGQDLGWFIAEWIDTIGVPTLQADYVIFKTASGFRVSGSIKQDRDLFRMPVEVEIKTKGNPARGTVELNGKSTPFDIETVTLPTQVVLDPDDKLMRDSPDLQTSVALSMGNDLKQKGDYVEAIRTYEKALKINPHKSIAHFRLAEVFYEQFNLQSAANSFRDALNGDKDPKWIETWCYIYLGKIYDILGQRQRAMAEYNKALNTKDDTDGAMAEAKKWLDTPFTRERTTMDREAIKQPE